MKLIPLTQGKFAMVDDEDFDELNKFKWSYYSSRRKEYAIRNSYTGKKHTTVRMHRQILNETNPEIFIDHEDGNGLNNQKLNLRRCSNKQNCANRRSHENVTSNYLGVYWRNDSKKWRVSGVSDGKRFNIGHFDNEIDAAKAYDAWAKINHKEFANLNFKNND